LFGVDTNGGSSIDQMLAGMDSPLEHDSRDDSALGQPPQTTRLVKFVNKVIIDALQKKSRTSTSR
jgi:hypothetical protein